jgi:hypothetical protein
MHTSITSRSTSFVNEENDRLHGIVCNSELNNRSDRLVCAETVEVVHERADNVGSFLKVEAPTCT